MRLFIKIIPILLIALFSSACNPILRTHGYIPNNDRPEEVNPQTDTKASVLARLGNPSLRGTFDEISKEDTWYYMTSVRQRTAYLRPLIEARSITEIAFNEEGQVTQVREYNIADRHLVDYVKRKTPTRGRELSVFEQIFGTIGRLPTQQLGGQRDLPGGSGPGGN